MDDLGEIVNEARRSALAPEQALLRMVSQRRASPRALSLALSCYQRAAGLIQQAIDALPKPKSEGD